MSRFIDKLIQVLQAAQPIGFRAIPSVSGRPGIQLVAGLPQADVDNLAGADAGLLRLSGSRALAKALEKMRQIAPDIPWGVRLEDADREVVKQSVEAGADFAVFSAAASLAPLEDDEVGKVLEVETSLSEGLLRVINDLPVDAVLITGPPQGHSLTWRQLMFFQYFADALTKPLLVTIPPGVTAGELQVIWEAGVSGVVVELGGEQPEEKLAALRRQIDELSPTPSRKKGKTRVLLPRIGGETGTSAEEEEE